MRKSIRLLILGLFACGTTQFSAAEPGASPRGYEMPEGKQFDFWIGEWDLTWPAGQGESPAGQPGRGHNSVKKILGNCIVQESFANSATQYRGMSVSAFQPKTGQWEQTWVDTEGNYLLFTGGFKDEVMELKSPPRKSPDGKTILSRMRFEKITPDSFDWTYQITEDDEKTWTTNWQIHYARSK